MKKRSREYRGNGGTMFGDIINYDETPSNFQKDFIKSSLNKDTLHQCLAERFIDFHYSTTLTLVVTCKDEILKTQDASDEDINSYKIWRSWCLCGKTFYQQIKMLFDTISVYSYDTDVLLLRLTYHHLCEFKDSSCTLFYKIGQGSSSKIYNVNVNAQAIGLNTCQALPFFHAFTAWDTVSTFLNHSKKSMWEAWHK